MLTQVGGPDVQICRFILMSGTTAGQVDIALAGLGRPLPEGHPDGKPQCGKAA